LLTFYAFAKSGGWSAVMQATPPVQLSLIRPIHDPSVPWPTLLITLPMLGFYFWGLSQAMVQRTLSARDINHGRWGNLMAAALNFAIFFIMVLPGLAGRVLFPNLEKPDQVYPKLVFEILPPGLTGIVVIGFIAAMTSTLASILNSAQTLVTMDIVSKLRPNLDNKAQVRAGQIAGFIIIIIAALWAPQIQKFDSLVKYFQQLLSYMAPPVVAVFLAGLFWKRASATGAFAGLLSGLGIGVFLLLFIKQTPLASWHFLYVAPVIFGVSLVIVVAASLVTKPPVPQAVERFVWKPAFFRAETEELTALPWFKNYRVLSIILLIVTIAFMVIWR
ncbi:MAG: sodium:solute symporter family transporter, partial [Verrucomicrobiota bacterium]